MIPVVTDPKKAAGALNWAVAEMTEPLRKHLQKRMCVRNLNGYNAKVDSIEVPEGQRSVHRRCLRSSLSWTSLQILMMVALKRCGGGNLSSGTAGTSCGHPSCDCDTASVRKCYYWSDQGKYAKSVLHLQLLPVWILRTILDMNGAEKLLGKGDMLFYPQGYQKPARLQGAFVSDDEVSAMLWNFLADKNRHGTDYDNED